MIVIVYCVDARREGRGQALGVYAQEDAAANYSQEMAAVEMLELLNILVILLFVAR